MFPPYGIGEQFSIKQYRVAKPCWQKVLNNGSITDKGVS